MVQKERNKYRGKAAYVGEIHMVYCEQFNIKGRENTYLGVLIMLNSGAVLCFKGYFY